LDIAQFIWQRLPNLIILKDRNGKFISSNQHTAKLFGYADESSLHGLDVYTIDCISQTNAKQFALQDHYVVQHRKNLLILDIHHLADQKQHVLLTRKTPFLINDELLGSLSYCTEIGAFEPQNFIKQLIDADKNFFPQDSLDERSYTLNKLLLQHNIKKRELDCLFYLIRGDKLKEISDKLKISKRTVESYLKKVKLKWHCNNKQQLIDYAVANGFLHYLPSGLLSVHVRHLIKNTN
jgi:DNA-binding CsgD family transcriptional regulator